MNVESRGLPGDRSHRAACDVSSSALMFRQCKRVSSKTLRRRWEKKHGKKWQKDAKIGKNQDVSHKKALGDRGTNDMDNLEPLPHDEHVRRHPEASDYKKWGGRNR